MIGNIEAEHQASEESEPRVLKFVYCTPSTVEWRSNLILWFVTGNLAQMTQDDLAGRLTTHRVDPDL
jgi:hypothetical protein